MEHFSQKTSPQPPPFPTPPLPTPLHFTEKFLLTRKYFEGAPKGRGPDFLSSPSTHHPTRYRLARPGSNTLFVTGIFQNADKELRHLLSLIIYVNFAIMGGGGSKYFSDLFRPQFSEYFLIFNMLHNSTIPGAPLGKLAGLS